MPARSSLARLLQAVLLLQVAAAALWWWFWRGSHPGVALAGAMAILLIAPIVLGLEFVLLGLIGQENDVPRPSAAALLRAWLAECREFARVFCWRMPFAWDAEPDHLAASTQGRPGVVFIHGFVCNRGIWTPWLRLLRARDHAFVAVNLEPVFTSIDRYVPIVEQAVERVTAATGQPPLVVCHSMGGLAVRAWLRAQAGNAQRVRHVVTIGSPHQGTWLARSSRVPNGREMRRGGDWLSALGTFEGRQPLPAFTCWYADCDNIVFPVATATLPLARNRLVPGAAHVDLAFHPQVMAETLALLEQAPPP